MIKYKYRLNIACFSPCACAVRIDDFKMQFFLLILRLLSLQLCIIHVYFKPTHTQLVFFL